MRDLHIGRGVTWPVALASQAIGVLGMRGAGKSNLGRVVAEELFASRVPFVVFDPIGNWYGIRAGRDGKPSGGVPIPIIGGEHGDLPLDRNSGQKIADLILDRRLSCVLDLSHADFSETDKRAFLVDFGERLFRKKSRESGWLTLIMEEADDYAPQQTHGGDKRGSTAACLGMFQRLVKRGRFKGLGALMITQRSAAINKDLLYMIGTLIAFRTTGPRDQEAIAGWVKHNSIGEKVMESLPKLEDGQAWTISPEALGKIEQVRFRRMNTYDTGATPEHGGGEEPATLADIDVPALSKELADAVERAKATDPAELQRQLREARATIAKMERATLAAAPAPMPEKVLIVTDEQLDAFSRQVTYLTRIADAGAQHHLAFVKEAGALRDQGNQIIAVLRAARQPLSRAVAGAPHASSATKTVGAGRPAASSRPAPVVPSGDLTGPERRILDALAWLESIGQGEPEQAAVAFLAGYTVGGGAFNNPRGALRTRGLIEYRGDRLSLTDAGRAIANTPSAPLTADELQARVLERLPGPEQKILRELIAVYPEALDNAELARRAGYEPGGGAFNNPRGRLRTLGLVLYPGGGRVAASPVLFLEGR